MKHSLITITIAILLAAAAGAAPLNLNREGAVELALENNPDFRISEISLEAAEREDRNAWNNFLPKISASAGLSGGSSLLDSADKSLAWSFNGAVNLSMPINAGLGYTIKGLQLAYEGEELSYEAARLTLIGEVEKEFYYLVASETNISIQEANLSLAQERYKQTRTRYDQGLASELSVLQAEVTAANLEPSYLQAISDYQARVREFLIVLGLDPETEISLEGSLNLPETAFDTEELIRLYLDTRQDIQSSRLALESAQNAKNFTVAETRTPTLNLSAGWNTTVGDPFNSGAWNYNTWTDGASLGLNLNIPLDGYIPGSSDAMTIQSKKDDVMESSISLAKVIAEARTEIINLVARLETSAASVDLSTLNVDLARKSYEMSEESYSRGILQRLDVEDAQQAYLEANQQFLVSQYEYLSSLIDLRYALGLESLEGMI